MNTLKLIFIGDGRNLPITNMFDVDGDATDNPDAAFSLVAMLPDGQWLATECRAGDIEVKDDRHFA